ncbi:adenosylmethionine--8-amino-7-oxononanoate transaminase [Aliidiomarina celeris]|uniref:adenosylmethionine--8-amino-7-oxononanoate transaminase n=1 Tax=Aliidiomarina celeris TaxID=2249428 RepID=UPI000DEAAEB7|nr:adenosylmethionine--8-amino-7-oxononanoate transaminase [Aliidiomarina celeris]
MIKFQPEQDDLAFDRTHIWHPYTSLLDPLPTYPVVSAEGVMLKLEDGRQLIDGMASWWSAIHGYNHPHLNQALAAQSQQMSHVMFGGITHPPAVALCRKLVELTPQPLEAVFLADSGSIAVEVAIKIALQYQTSRGNMRKQRLATIRRGYHGDTFATMAVCDPINGMHEHFRGVLPEHYFVPAPEITPEQTWDPAEIAPVQVLFEQHHESIAAFILEPIVQGAGGMRFYHPEYLKALRALTERYDILLIADEIATGFGRTGKLFACEHANIVPDILCLGKALTGGYMTLAATLTTLDIAHSIGRGPHKVLMHGPTFMGNPLACAVAHASLELIQRGDWQQQVPRIEQELRAGLAPCLQGEGVVDVRVFGAIGVVEFAQPLDVARVQAVLVEDGIWIRPFGRLLYVMPPYISETKHIAALTAAMVKISNIFP